MFQVVKQLRTSPPLNDIAARLRYLADQIESGACGPYETVLVFAMHPDSFMPDRYCFGNNSTDRHQMAGILLHGAQLALTGPND